MTPQCASCGGTAADGALLPPRKPRGLPRLCSDCARVTATTEARPKAKPRTRASYRAAYRRRAGGAQLDFVDQLVPPP